jgi:hypothetical protein
MTPNTSRSFLTDSEQISELKPARDLTAKVYPCSPLPHRKASWPEWSRKLSLAVRQCGLHSWLDDKIPSPDETVSPDAYHVWMHNDDTHSAFTLSHVSNSDIHHCGFMATRPTDRDAYVA